MGIQVHSQPQSFQQSISSDHAVVGQLLNGVTILGSSATIGTIGGTNATITNIGGTNITGTTVNGSSVVKEGGVNLTDKYTEIGDFSYMTGSSILYACHNYTDPGKNVFTNVLTYDINPPTGTVPAVSYPRLVWWWGYAYNFVIVNDLQIYVPGWTSIHQYEVQPRALGGYSFSMAVVIPANKSWRQVIGGGYVPGIGGSYVDVGYMIVDLNARKL